MSGMVVRGDEMRCWDLADSAIAVLALLGLGRVPLPFNLYRVHFEGVHFEIGSESDPESGLESGGDAADSVDQVAFEWVCSIARVPDLGQYLI